MVEDQSNADNMPLEPSPPLDPSPPQYAEALPPEPTKWPTTIGIISIIYACLGITCVGIGSIIGAFVGDFMGAAFGVDVETPVAFRIQAMVGSCVALILGIILLLGGIKLMKRQATGVKLLKTWVVTRLIWLFISVVITIALFPSQIEFQRNMHDMQRDMIRDRGGDPSQVPPFNEDQVRLMSIVQIGVGTVIVTIYPVFLGFYLSRNKIKTEVDEWGSTDWDQYRV